MTNEERKVERAKRLADSGATILKAIHEQQAEADAKRAAAVPAAAR